MLKDEEKQHTETKQLFYKRIGRRPPKSLEDSAGVGITKGKRLSDHFVLPLLLSSARSWLVQLDNMVFGLQHGLESSGGNKIKGEWPWESLHLQQGKFQPSPSCTFLLRPKTLRLQNGHVHNHSEERERRAHLCRCDLITMEKSCICKRPAPAEGQRPGAAVSAWTSALVCK